jgi:hypothetical protein
MPTLGLVGALFLVLYLRRNKTSGRALHGSAEDVEAEEAMESIEQAERTLRAISGCTPQSLVALQDAEREIGAAIASAAGTDPETRKVLQKRISGLTRMASQANASLTRCITRK